MFSAKRRYKNTKGRNFSGCVEPQNASFLRYCGNHVVKLSGRRNVLINVVRGADQRRIGLYSYRSQQRSEKRVLVLTVAVLIREHFVGRMGLIAAYPEG